MAAGLTALPALFIMSPGTPAQAATSVHQKETQPPVRYVQVSNVQTCNPDGLCTFRASCPSGTVITGGGVSVSPLISSGLYLMESEPDNSTTWKGTVRNNTQFPVTVTVKAICVRLPGV
ncbi:hypothetical protein AMK32_35985 [Streptomyces sp. CB01883]|nr:hypothetical protein AMK32_35985 [Streptomyces sp. CB01883]